jgi:replicative DNA helicase
MVEERYYTRDYTAESPKTPPHSIQAEQSVLGALMLDNATWDSIASLVTEKDFYRKEHQVIFQAIAHLAQAQSPFDVITISETLHRMAKPAPMGSWLAYVGMIANDTPSAANIVSYAEIVRDYSILRQLIHVGTEISNFAFAPQNRKPQELLEEAEKKVLGIAEQVGRDGGFQAIKTLLAHAVDKIETLFEQEGHITGAATGFTDFDEKTSGLQPADLIIIAGRPSMGKCFGKGTPILMYSGDVKPVEEIQVGDLLMGDDSTPRRVLSLAQGQEAMYWVRQNNGLDYRVNQSHILSLKHSANHSVLNIALTDYLSCTPEFQSSYQGYKATHCADKSSIQIEYDQIDDYYGFICDGNRLFLLADRTVVHNTTIAMNIAENIAIKGDKPVAVFSMEMPGDSLAMRMMSSLGRIDQLKVRTGKLEDDEWPRLTSAINILAETKLFIDDTPALTPTELSARARRLAREHGQLGLVVVDYLQLMQSPSSGDNRVQQVSDISRGLKALAKELHVPVIALSQLNRNLEQRPNKRPVMSDLRESGCLVGDSLVTCAKTGQRYPIRDLVGRTDFRVWALNEQTLQLEAAPVSNAFATGIKPVFRLTTQLGRTIRATANHKFYSDRGWQRLDELTLGQYLAVPRLLPEPIEPNLETALTYAECALLGHLIGDGCTLPRHAIQYTTRELDLAELVVQLAKEIFADEVEPRIKKERTWYQVYLTSTRQHTHGVRSVVSEWLDKLGIFGLRSHEKRVPETVFAQTNDKIAVFLRHLWVTDGCVKLSGNIPRIYYASSSQQLCHDVQTLLLRLGINARLTCVPQGAKGRNQYHVVLSGLPDILGFAYQISTLGQYKSQSLHEILAFCQNKVPKTNRDIIPNKLWIDNVSSSMKKLGISHRELHQKIGTAYAGMTIFRQNLSRERANRIAEASHCEKLAQLAQSGIYWDKIAHIEQDGEEEVFDLTVPQHHNFVVNEIVAHNSIEQDADLIVFVYRDEVYNEDSPDKGIAEVIIGKQRNGPLGTVRLTFLGQYTRFENFAGNSYSSEDYE